MSAQRFKHFHILVKRFNSLSYKRDLELYSRNKILDRKEAVGSKA